ncbi:MAG: XdhC/CoxI family protein [Planctomycetota bacterium]|nr:MAG: XdhC/CoxI family protein [Planctomycetota bacterium]REJ95826.1 MAG: XdhC/CoxI family protein [Planctomycetota bacterium]REK27406.1 MAG: XdhC/CoxI family protein [Planctomycetota bacterium]REK36915.1 MAG: XdhC/CoxI family protein [Planctomycetota bacterium]
MRTLIEKLLKAHREGGPVAYTALVETRGSTPQKAGAAMLVFPDGSQAGTLGGGCVEAEVKRRALELLADGRPQLLSFQLDHDYGWDDGLICGGRMLMLVDPIRPGDDVTYYEELDRLLQGARGATQAVVIDAERAGLADATCVLLDESGTPLAVRGDGGGLDAVLSHLRPLVERPRPYVDAGVSYLPHLPRCRLIIVGGGHVGASVAELARQVDFDVWIVDDREEYCNPDRFPQAEKLICGNMEDVLTEIDVTPDTFCIIVTRGHNHDETALLHLAERPARYIGMIGSKRKIRLIFDDLRRSGISDEVLERVHAPIGFDIGSQTVPEIAVSIVAELISHRNLGGAGETVVGCETRFAASGSQRKGAERQRAAEKS